ncbi:MAG TPA: protein kinase [Gemmatimonadaceae bacterium]|nr:protein kinase [Gemmatimonadaceae bacterium]
MIDRTGVTTALAGRYDVEREVGRGGMATVYLARDRKHDRRVALKMLNQELGAILGVERFLAEIKVTANLQHPNLLPLFDSGEADGHLYYVMPYVEGESLRHRLDRETQLPVEEAMQITIAVANALDYAHAHGVIHRDLKPENILLQHGQPIVADFGIALAISNAGGPRVTQTGLSLGTPQYMSPEQAAGDRAIDGRSDIYALGAILYEMLAGEPPHIGNSVQAVIAKVLTERPRGVRMRRDTVPAHVERAIDKALAKLPADRFGSARQFIDALQHPKAAMETDLLSPLTPTERTRATRLRQASVIGGCVMLALLGGVGGFALARRNAPRAERVVRFGFHLPVGSRAAFSYFGSSASMSPDGRQIVYVGPPTATGAIWVRDLDAGADRLVAGTIDGIEPRFAPDGRWIIWFNHARLTWYRTPVGGGSVTPIVRTIGPRGFDWYAPDSVVYSPQGLDAGGHLYATSMKGDTARFLVGDSSGASIAQADPVVAPDRRTILFVSRRRSGSDNQDELAYATLDDRRVHPISFPARNVLGYAAGAIIYVQGDGAIMALPYDIHRHAVRGDPIPTGERAQMDVYGPKASLSPSGDLVYRGGNTNARVVLVGKNAVPTPIISDRRDYSHPRYSPEGRRLAIGVFDGTRTDIWVYTLASAGFERLTTDGTANERPEWSPDGRYIVYRSNRSGREAIWRKLADGSGATERVSPPLDIPAHEGVVTSDGRTLVYRVDDPVGARDIYAVPLEGSDRRPRPVMTTEFDELAPRLSPDGKWIAYVSNESGRYDVYVRPFPSLGGRVVISSGGGVEPLWSRDGRQIFYRSPSSNSIIAASMSLSDNPEVLARDTIVADDFISNPFHPMYDVAPDGKRLLLLEGDGNQRQLTVILNWTTWLADRLSK